MTVKPFNLDAFETSRDDPEGNPVAWSIAFDHEAAGTKVFLVVNSRRAGTLSVPKIQTYEQILAQVIEYYLTGIATLDEFGSVLAERIALRIIIWRQQQSEADAITVPGM